MSDGSLRAAPPRRRIAAFRVPAIAAIAVVLGCSACRPREVPAPTPPHPVGTSVPVERPPDPTSSVVPVNERPRVVVLRRGAARPASGPPALFVDVAATAETRRIGLGGRTRLEPDHGMLFVYAAPVPRKFWMKDCPFGLDIAFLDGGGRIVRLASLGPGTGLADEDLPNAESGVPVSFVLESEQGWFQRNGVREGDRIDVSAAAAGVVAE